MCVWKSGLFQKARRLFFLAFSLCLFTASLHAEEVEEVEEAEEEYILPETEIIEAEEKNTPEKITREEMDRDDAKDLWEAARYTPGVILSGGGRRNDSNFSVRGYGADSVPIYVDGIPLANPYRGESDSARLLAGDLESIEIEKGYSSELLGANNLGGAVLLTTAKPAGPLELSLKSSVGFDSVFHYADMFHALKAGTRQHYFYALGVLQYRDIDHYRLPAAFEPAANNPQESGDRLWSDSKDVKATVMAGVTPARNADVWLHWTYQWADKGLSPPDTNTRDFSIWNWPVWKRWSLSLNGDWTPGDFQFHGLFYYDKYDNRLDEYYNLNAYELGIHAPHSDYDEYTAGARLSAAWEINSKNLVQAALTYLKEDHTGLRGTIYNEDDLEPEMRVNEDTWSFGAEYTARFWEPVTIKAGAGFDALVPIDYWNEENEYLKFLEADYFIVKSQTMFLYTWQAAVFYALTPKHELRFSYSRKNHFPTMSDRYSTRFGSTLPNPNLGPEKANHFELGYRGRLPAGLTLDAAAYYSWISGKIVTIELPNPHYPSALVDYRRNLDRTAFWGIEAAPAFTLDDWLEAGLTFSYNRYAILKSQFAVQYLTYYPALTLGAFSVIKLKLLNPIFSLIPRLEYIGPRYADTSGLDTLPGYFLFHFKISAAFPPHIECALSLNNLFDTLYEIRRNSPMPGRTLTLSLTLKY